MDQFENLISMLYNFIIACRDLDDNLLTGELPEFLWTLSEMKYMYEKFINL